MKKRDKIDNSFVDDAFLAELFDRLLDLRDKIKSDINPKITNISLLNMKHYLNLRKYDISNLQDDLTKVGLSSFGRSQAHLEASVMVVLRMLAHALGRNTVFDKPLLSYENSHALMNKNAKIFSSSDDKTKIMMTVPSNYNEHDDWFGMLCREGVHLFRINTAHDSPTVWADMAKRVDELKEASPKIYVDLSGPKIRTVLKNKKIRVFYGDKIVLQAASTKHKSPKHNGCKAVIGCTLEKLGSITNIGDPIFIDDGKVQLVVDEIYAEDIVCKVVSKSEKGSKIKDEKGINLPNSDISLKALTLHDKEILSDICSYADIIGISFAQSSDDVYELINELEALGKSGEIGIVAKIETKKGVKNLPSILEALLEYGHSGIMIARGDLAIEIGFENLAAMQQEILDLCAAAHMPVILATQVLESKMKTNIPSRAEISDVIFAHKAECVMLNKGLYEVETVKILKTIFSQMNLVFRKNKLLYNTNFEWK